MTTPVQTSEYEVEDKRVIIVGGKDVSHYFWAVGQRFRYHNEIVLQFMPYNEPTVIRMLDVLKQFGIAEKHGSRKEVMTKDKEGKPIIVREVLIKKPGMLLP